MMNVMILGRFGSLPAASQAAGALHNRDMWPVFNEFLLSDK